MRISDWSSDVCSSDPATAANERSLGSTIDVPVGDKLVLHADGSYAKSGDLEIGGPVLSPALRAQASASGDPEIEALADLKGKLPNSASRTWTAGAGASVITDGGNMGFSVDRKSTRLNSSH